MDLEKVIDKIRIRRLSDSDDALSAIAESEKYLQQAYEGRFLFELIQNVRDANKKAGMLGSVYIELKDDILSVSNTGAPFDEDGIVSITTIGKSPKKSQEFIGFKGIGFKSVQEVTDKPRIVTIMGTIEFNKDKSSPIFKDRNLKKSEIPLFFFPHYIKKSLENDEIEKGIVTKVLLPISENKHEISIKRSYDRIGIHQFLLLGSLKSIHFKTDLNTFFYEIEEKPNTGNVTITTNENVYQFKLFKPKKSYIIPEEIIDSLDDKEKEIYEKNSSISISAFSDGHFVYRWMCKQ